MLLHGRVGFREERPGQPVKLASAPLDMPQTGVAGSWATSSWSQLTNHEAPESAYLPGGRALLRGLAEQEADLLEGPRECVSGCHVSGSVPRFCVLAGAAGCGGQIAGSGGRATKRASFEEMQASDECRWNGLEVDFRELHNPCTRLHRAQRYRGTTIPAAHLQEEGTVCVLWRNGRVGRASHFLISGTPSSSPNFFRPYG